MLIVAGMARALAGAAVLLGLLAFSTGAASVERIPVARSVESVPAVGPLFFPSVAGLLPALGAPHSCTASVVHSARGDLVITAAHCVYGTGATIEFVPDFHDDIAPYGVWSVRRIYVDPSWPTRQDPAHDVAFLQVAPRRGERIEEVVGARRLGHPRVGHPVTVTGYPAGSGGRPVTCTNTLWRTAGYPRVECAGLVGGTSGGPWVQAGRVVGVVGGLEQGGCTDSTSYSAPFGADVSRLYARAQAGGPGDLLPVGVLANACR